MENKQKVGSPSSSSSFTNDLFGAKKSVQPPASTGIFSSIFPPPSTVLGRNTQTSEFMGSIQWHSAGSQGWNKGTSGDISKNKEDATYSTSNKERNSVFQVRAEPCPLSSSLYYGGQENMYMNSPNPQSFGSYPNFKKVEGEDDQNANNSHGASRGNWWQGSLYY